MRELEDKLDLKDFLKEFRELFAREKDFKFEGDSERHLQFINSLESIDFKSPEKVDEIFPSIAIVRKFGILSLSQIFEIVKIIRYFLYLKKIRFVGVAGDWISKIDIPPYFIEFENFFDKNGKIKDEVDERLISISIGIGEVRENIRTSLYGVLHSSRLEDFLVDKQIHYINEREALLLRGGFNAVLKGEVVGRSSSGFFYVVPDNLSNLNKRLRDYEQEREAIYLQYRKDISKKLHSFIPFMKFIDREFDRFDHYQARLFFAKGRDLEFLKPSKERQIIIKDFYHPAIKNSPKPLNLEFRNSVLMVTGVNAGGKTMLLKSILSIALLSKYLIPMKINSNFSQIGRFKGIEAVIDDPQNVNFDISTFAGRMVSFSELLSKDNFLIGVDEVELGTDADEASALFKVLLEKLIERNSKIIITTHHKRLASLMGTHKEVDLLAALYDEEKRTPTYRFLHGIVGKSYAFETAERYGIPKNLVEEAKIVHGDDKEKLNELIEKSANIEQQLIEKREKLDLELENLELLKRDLQQEKDRFYHGLENKKGELQTIYSGAISEAKMSIKAKTIPDTHKHMTEAHKMLPKDEVIEDLRNYELKVGEKVKYNESIGTILQIRGKYAKVEINGMRVDLKLDRLQRALKIPTVRTKVEVKVEKPDRASLRLDLHGKRREEALEELDQFLSNALLQGWDEVFITHGVGTGVLAKAVTQFLREHPRVDWFGDAPPNMGGKGGKLVRF